MDIKLDVSLNPNGGGNVSPDSGQLPTKVVGSGMVWKINGATVNGIKLILGRVPKNFKLTLLDEDGNELAWPDGSNGVNLSPPPPPPGVSHSFEFE